MARIGESSAVSNRFDSKVLDRCIVVRNKFQGDNDGSEKDRQVLLSSSTAAW